MTADWITGGHGHVIPAPVVAGCGGADTCGQCARELLFLIYAAQAESNGIDECGGPGVCTDCRAELQGTGIDLTHYTRYDSEIVARALIVVRALPALALPRYTLDEARAELARRECAADGHDWSMVMVRHWGAAGEFPAEIICDRPCGHPGYDVVVKGHDLEHLEPQAIEREEPCESQVDDLFGLELMPGQAPHTHQCVIFGAHTWHECECGACWKPTASGSDG